MDAAQGCLSGPMPDAVTVPHAPRRISRRCAGLPAAGTPPRRLLRRLLLGFDGSFVRGRGDECALDRAPGTARPSGETYSLRPMDRAHCWRCLCCGRGLDVVAYIFTIGRRPRLEVFIITTDPNDYSLLTIFLVSIVFLVAASEAGRLLGVRAAGRGGDDVSTLEAAILGLLALMI